MKKFNKQCPWCHGAGGYIEPVLDFGQGPWEPCGFCKGIGQIKNKKLFYQALGWLSGIKRKRKTSKIKKEDL
jgi:DnaJ-class molecular chaperone